MWVLCGGVGCGGRGERWGYDARRMGSRDASWDLQVPADDEFIAIRDRVVGSIVRAHAAGVPVCELGVAMGASARTVRRVISGELWDPTVGQLARWRVGMRALKARLVEDGWEVPWD